MTVLCGGGASGPKAGVAETVIFTAGALASLLNNKGGAWATLAAPLLGVLTYQVEELCENDPPADPGLTSDDYLALLKLSDWPAVQSALAKLATKIQIAAWYELCECKTVGTPAFPSGVLAAPADTVVMPSNSAPCWTATRVYDARYSAGPAQASDFHTEIFPAAPIYPIANIEQWSGSAPFIDTPADWTSYRLAVQSLGGLPAGQVNKATASLYESSQLTGDGGVVGPQANVTVSSEGYPGGANLYNVDPSTPINWPSGGLSLRVLAHEGHNVPHRVQVTFDAFCGQAGSVASPCGPDPAVHALLHQILSLLTVVQRNGVPFAYAPHSEHAGLSGVGEVAATETIAVTVTLTTLPGSYGMAEGHPDVVFDAGYIAFGNAEGFGAPQRIRTSPMFLRVPTDATRVGYALGPGIVATIKRHAAEP